MESSIHHPPIEESRKQGVDLSVLMYLFTPFNSEYDGLRCGLNLLSLGGTRRMAHRTIHLPM